MAKPDAVVAVTKAPEIRGLCRNPIPEGDITDLDRYCKVFADLPGNTPSRVTAVPLDMVELFWRHLAVVIRVAAIS